MSITIEMVSDLVCPWCWLGLRRLQAAREMTPGIEAEILFRPFELDPAIPREGVDYKAYMQAKLGGSGGSQEDPARSRFRAMRDALEQYGAEEGIPFAFDGITVRPNTLDAHRLVRWAQGQDAGADAKEALFAAYFRDHRDIGRQDVLVEIAGEIGLDRDIVSDLLARDADLDSVRREEEVFREMGVRGVPTYIGDRRVAVQGAESADKLTRFIRTLAERAPQERPMAGTR